MHLLKIYLNTGTGEQSVNKWEDKLTGITFLKKLLWYFIVNLKVMCYFTSYFKKKCNTNSKPHSLRSH